MDNAVIAKDLAAITRAVFSKLSSGTEERIVQEWMLQKCAEDLLGAVGRIDCDVQNAYLAELAIPGGMNAVEDCLGHGEVCVVSEDGARVTEATPIFDSSINCALLSIAERHLQAGIEDMPQDTCEFGPWLTDSSYVHFSILNVISPMLDEPRRRHLVKKKNLLAAETNLREAKANLAQAEAALRRAEGDVTDAEQTIAEVKQASGDIKKDLDFPRPSHWDVF